jgi:hypothetical protein
MGVNHAVRFTTRKRNENLLALAAHLSKEPVILSVVSDPKPLNSFRYWNTKRTIVKPDADAAEAAAVYGFKLK